MEIEAQLSLQPELSSSSGAASHRSSSSAAAAAAPRSGMRRMMAGCNIAVLLLLLLLLLSPEQGDALPAPTPAPLIHIAPGVELPQVVLGTGSGQKGNVSAAT
eukprot:COSAG01_NODE_46991_length_394_cov_11.915254_1_plen_102_part_10